MENKFRSLPSVDKLLSDSKIRQLGDVYPHNLLVDLIRQRLEQDGPAHPQRPGQPKLVLGTFLSPGL